MQTDVRRELRGNSKLAASGRDLGPCLLDMRLGRLLGGGPDLAWSNLYSCPIWFSKSASNSADRMFMYVAAQERQ